MMNRACALLVSLLLASPAWAEEPSDTLLDLLSRAPLAALASGPGAFVHVADLDAARRAADSASEPIAPWMRAGSPAFNSSLRSGLDGEWATRVGFGPDDIEATLTIMAPPRRGLVVRLASDAAPRVEPALLAAGYGAATHDGLDALARGEEDHAVSLRDIDPADPLGGELGMSGRAAVQGSDLVWSNEWPLLHDLAREPAADPRVSAFASALDLPDWGAAQPMQAVVWLNPFDFAPGLPPALLELDPTQREQALEELLGDAAEGIPPWSLAMLTDMAPRDGALTLVLFAYGDRASADEAAERLAVSFPRARSQMTSQSFAELTRATAETMVTGDGPFVTVLALRGAAEDGNRAFQVLLRGWQSRDLPFFGPA